MKTLSSTDPAAPAATRSRRTPKERPGPVGGKRDGNRQRRTKGLSDAGLRLFLTHGIELVTIDDIVREAGVAKGSFYRYFEDKADLVDALVGPLNTRVCEAFAACDRALAVVRPGEPAESLMGPYMTLAMALTQLVLEDADVIRLYLQESRAPAVGARLPIANLARGVREGAIALATAALHHQLVRGIDPRIVATAVVGAV
ncbi:MAG: helix-turn-helix domain-containing protein, partial [Deltaproteobacteria bacterium]